MNALFEKQIYIRLSDDGSAFLYTVKRGRLITHRGEIGFSDKGDLRALPGVLDPCYVRRPARSVPTERR